MALESVNFIGDLDPANPVSGDTITQGDNHIRNIKQALRNTFPNISGAVTVTEEDLNAVEGIGDTITAALQGVYPVGSIYMNTLSDNPATLLGFGTWERIANGRAIVGVGDNGEYNWSALETRGADTVVLSGAHLPAHAHTVPGQTVNTSSAGDHSHGAGTLHASAKSSRWYSYAGGNDGIVDPRNVQYTDSVADVDDSIYVTNQTNHSHVITGSTASAGSHWHSVTIPGTTTGTSGSSAAVNNVQPSLAVYIWRRTS